MCCISLEAPSTETSKVESKLRDGIWLGIVDRTEEAIIGTEHGIVKCRTVKRRPEGQQWSREALEKTKGTVQQPVPGSHNDRIPTGIVGEDDKPVRTTASRAPKDVPPRSQPSTRLAKAPRAMKIFIKDVEKYGATPGCQACTEILIGRDRGKGTAKYIVPHSEDCRARMKMEMSQDPIDRG